MKKFALRHDYEIDLDFKNKPMTCNFSTTKPFLDLWDDRTKVWLIVVRILRGFPHAEFEAIHQRISFISVRHRKRCFLASKSTDLGSLIWIFDCENLAIFQPLWFYVKINCGWFQKVKNCHFNNFGGFEFCFMQSFTLENVKTYHKFRIQRCSNCQNGSFWGFKMTKIDFT